MRLLLRFGLRHHRRHPLQTLLTLLGIAAGVALLVAMQTAQRTAESAFDQALATVAGNATHTVTAGPDGLPVAAYAALRRELGGRGVAPSVRLVARVGDGETLGERAVLRVLGVDPLADAELRPWAAPGGDGGAFPLGALLTRSGAFVATKAVLARLRVQRGSELLLTIGGRPVRAHCLGELQAPPAIAAGLDDVLLVDIATAQEWSGRLDRIDRLDLRLAATAGGEEADRAAEPAAEPASERERALAAVVRHCGPGARIVATGAQQGGLGHLARGFRINLTALSLLSLLVGAFLVHETMRLSVVARREAFGVLRALGVTGGQLARAVVVETAVLGLLGSALGALLGAFAAQALLQPLVRTLNDHYATFSLQQVRYEPLVLVACVLVGALVAMAAGLAPAIAAGRVNARDVLVPARAASGERRRPWARIAVFTTFAALATALLSTVGTRLVQGYLGTLLLVLAAVVVVPPAMGVFLQGVGALVRGCGPFVRYVVRSTAAARPHLGLPVAAMVLALGTTIGMATLVGSFRDSVAGWLAQVLPGDVFASVPGGHDDRAQPFAPAIVAAMREVPGVAARTEYHRTVVPMRIAANASAQASANMQPRPDEEIEVDVVGVRPTPRWSNSFPLLQGDDPRGRTAIANGDGAWISEPLAFRCGLQLGDLLTIRGTAGPARLPIAAIYRDYSNERGEAIVAASWLQQHVRAPVTALGFEATPGVDAEPLARALRAAAAAADEQAVSVRVQGELRSSSLQVFDRTFAITGVMRLLCLCVAFVGIYAAFAALQLERAGEIGLLRCLGARPRQIGFVVLAQTALLGLCAGLLALPLGVLLGHVLAHVINRVSFGWTLVTVSVPWSALGEVLVLAIVAATLAGVQPAWRFARMRPAEGLREA